MKTDNVWSRFVYETHRRALLQCIVKESRVQCKDVSDTECHMLVEMYAINKEVRLIAKYEGCNKIDVVSLFV